MKSHSKPCRNAEDDTETDAKKQSDHGSIIVRAEIPGDDYSCPYSDVDNHCRYYGTNYTSDDNIRSPTRNIFGKSG